MLNLLWILAAAPGAPMVPAEPIMREIRILPMPYEWHTLSQPHPNSDDRMFPDIAVKDMRIDGDTLYVKVANQGRSSASAPIMVIARATENGTKTEEVRTRTDRLNAGESRWVSLKGFAIKSASLASPVFQLASASAVSAAAWLLPSTSGTLDRSGQGCGECSADVDASNNILTLTASSIRHTSPDR